MGSTALVAIALACGNVAVAKSPPASVPPADQDAVVGYECRTTTSRRTLSGNVARSAEAIELNALLLDADVSLVDNQGSTLYLLTNRKCAPAIHLYEKLGFEHDAAIMAEYGARYKRCDVAMRYRGGDPA